MLDPAARQLVIVDVDEPTTHRLRRGVMRPDRPDLPVHFAQDAIEGSWHLGAQVGDEIVGVASFHPVAYPREPVKTPAWQLRMMAVDPAWQGNGVGARLLTEAVLRLRQAEAAVLWANARDTALGFYRRCGFDVVGNGYPSGELELPHHMVVLALR